MSVELCELPHERDLVACVEELRLLPHSLWFAVGAEATLRERVTQRLAEVGRVHSHEIADEPELWGIVARDHQPGDIHLLMLRALAEPESAQRWLRLNLGREWRIKGNAHLIVWSPDLASFRQLRERAPDLWAHRTGVLWWVGEADFVGGLEVAPGPGETLTEGERLERALAGHDAGELFLALCARSRGSGLHRLPEILRAAAHAPSLRHAFAEPVLEDWWLVSCGESGGVLGRARAGKLLAERSGTMHPVLAVGIANTALSGLRASRTYASLPELSPANHASRDLNAMHRAVSVERVLTTLQIEEPQASSEEQGLNDAREQYFRVHALAYYYQQLAAAQLLSGDVDQACETLFHAIPSHVELDQPAQLQLDLSLLGRCYRHLGQRTAWRAVLERRLVAEADHGLRLSMLRILHGDRTFGDRDPGPLVGEMQRIGLTVGQVGSLHERAWLRFELARSGACLARWTKQPSWLEKAEEHLSVLDAIPDEVPALPRDLEHLDPASSVLITRGILRLAAERDARVLPPFPLDFKLDPAGELRGDALRLRSVIAWIRGDGEAAFRHQQDHAARYEALEWWPRAATAWGGAVDLAVLLRDPARGFAALARAQAALDHERDADFDLRDAGLLAWLAMEEARLAWISGDGPRILAALDRGIWEVRAAGNLIREPMLFRGLAAFTDGLLDLDTRLAHARHARDLARAQRHLLEEMKGTWLLARLLKQAGRQEEAAAADAEIDWVQARLPGRLSLTDDPSWEP